MVLNNMIVKLTIQGFGNIKIKLQTLHGLKEKGFYLQGDLNAWLGSEIIPGIQIFKAC